MSTVMNTSPTKDMAEYKVHYDFVDNMGMSYVHNEVVMADDYYILDPRSGCVAFYQFTYQTNMFMGVRKIERLTTVPDPTPPPPDMSVTERQLDAILETVDPHANPPTP